MPLIKQRKTTIQLIPKQRTSCHFRPPRSSIPSVNSKTLFLEKIQHVNNYINNKKYYGRPTSIYPVSLVAKGDAISVAKSRPHFACHVCYPLQSLTIL